MYGFGLIILSTRSFILQLPREILHIADDAMCMMRVCSRPMRMHCKSRQAFGVL